MCHEVAFEITAPKITEHKWQKEVVAGCAEFKTWPTCISIK